jgi:hypothetical protein
MLEKLAPNPRPVNYSARIRYAEAGVVEFQRWPVTCGVYLLIESGRYYIGQSVDVAGRFASHRLNPVSCKFTNPRCVLLASIPTWSVPWNQNARRRLVAEARFISAALAMELPLTNVLTLFKREKLLGQFSDLACERERLSRALQLLGAQ